MANTNHSRHFFESITALETREIFWLPHCRVKHTRSETLKAKSLVLNRSSVQGTLAVENKETLNQIKQTNKQIKTTTTTTKQKTTTNERERKEAFKSGGSM